MYYICHNEMGFHTEDKDKVIHTTERTSSHSLKAGIFTRQCQINRLNFDGEYCIILLIILK